LKDELKQILSDTLGVAEKRITEESSVENMENWDSLAHLNIVMSLEQHFGISISPVEAVEMTNLKSMRQVLRNRGINA
jgi:acyl carrier protein